MEVAEKRIIIRHYIYETESTIQVVLVNVHDHRWS